MILLETSVIVDHLRGVEPAVALLERFLFGNEALMAGELTRFELLAGVPEETEGVEQLCAVLDWVPVTDDISRQAGEHADLGTEKS